MKQTRLEEVQALINNMRPEYKNNSDLFAMLLFRAIWEADQRGMGGEDCKATIEHGPYIVKAYTGDPSHTRLEILERIAYNTL